MSTHRRRRRRDVGLNQRRERRRVDHGCRGQRGRRHCQEVVPVLSVRLPHALHQGDLIIVDFGTATTFDVVDYDGAYKGGIIAPGINLSLDALVAAAAKLPRIAIEVPATRSVIGRTTEEQMLIGVYWGYVAMIEGLIARMKAEIGKPLTVIATGGLATLFQEQAHLFDRIEPDLTLNGLMHLYNQRGISA